MAFGIVSSQSTSVNETSAIKVSGASATAGAKQVTLKWSDPKNAKAGWGGTLVIRKEGSAPADKSDGTIVINSTKRDAYASTGFVDTDVENGKTYYYAMYPYTTAGKYSEATTVSAQPYFIEVTVPTFIGSSSLTYDGNSKTPGINNPDSSYVEVVSASSTQSATDVGDYDIVYKLKDTTKQKWKDGTNTNKTLTWHITKANQTINLSEYSVTLNTATTSKTITITQTGTGTLSATVTGSAVVTTNISGKTLTITRVSGNLTGSCTVTVNAAANSNYNAGSSTAITVNCVNYRKMTVKIDESDSNPETCCTYADDAVNMTPGSSDWDDFFGHYPCLFAGGVEGVKLNPNNYDKDINGNAVTIDSGNNDVMVAFPRRGLNISKSGDIITITMTDNPNDSSFEYMAHKRGTTVKDKFYIGAYMGSEISSKLRSLKGQTIANNKTHGAFRTLAQANGAPNNNGGSGYDQHGFYQLTYLQAMYLLKYKSLSSQTKIGRGFVDGNSAQKATGGTETWGMDKGETTGKDHMKLFGIEDLWGNVWSWIDGFWFDSSHRVCTNTQNFNSDGSNYTARDIGASSDQSWNYSTKVIGTTHSGFVSTQTSGGSESTYYCDYCYSIASRLLLFGGYWSDGSRAGVFCLDVYNDASFAYAIIGSRLMYL